MVNSTYAKAYTEVLEIIKYFPVEEYAKIPIEKINFYKANMDKDYKFTINPEVDLAKQNISKEANATIVALYMDYFATEEQKIKIKEKLNSNQIKAEQRKREQYDPENIFKTNKQKNISSDIPKDNTQLIEHNESFFTKFKNFIFNLLHINNKNS